MSASDKIQLAIAIVAGLAAILTFWNISITSRQMRLQKAQWEFSYSPVFKIIHADSVHPNMIYFIINDMNNVFYKIDSVNFKGETLSTSWSAYNSIILGETKYLNKREYAGLEIKLLPKHQDDIKGYFLIEGFDGLNNKFVFKSSHIHLKDKVLQNKFHLINSYLEKI